MSNLLLLLLPSSAHLVPRDVEVMVEDGPDDGLIAGGRGKRALVPPEGPSRGPVHQPPQRHALKHTVHLYGNQVTLATADSYNLQ